MNRHLYLLVTVTLLAGGVGVAQQPPAPSGDAQQPPARFEVNVNFVEVPTVVTDRNGEFVRGLSRDDFEVFEDGVRQTLSVFEFVDLPVRRPFTPAYTTEPVEPDIHRTRPTFDGRLYILMLDDLHTSVFRTQAVRDTAKRFIEQGFSADDLGAVVYTSGRSNAGQELTDRRSLLLAAVERFQGRKLPSATSERAGVYDLQRTRAGFRAAFDPDNAENADVGGINTRGREIDEPDAPERIYNARAALSAMKQAAEWMRDVRGRRKALVLFSEGLEYDIYAPFSRSGGSLLLFDARDAVAAAQEANLSIYAVDARGLTQFPREAINTVLSRDPDTPVGTALAFQRELLMSQESMIGLADDTGGFAVVNTNDLAGGLDRIVRDNSTYYLLGYATDPDRSPGEFREIEVRVKRPELQVRARRGFLPSDAEADRAADEVTATKDGADASPAFDVAMNTPLPVGELQFRVSAAPFKGTDEDASVLVVIEIDGPSLKFQKVGERFNERIDVSIVALDYDGEIQGGDDQTIELSLRQQSYEVVSRHGVRLTSRLELPASRYQMRVGVREAAGGAVGALPFELELPDYAETSFALSGLVLTSTGAASVPTPNPDPQLAELFPTPPSATRVFTSQETLSVFAELYSGASSSRRQVDFLVTVRDASDGRTVFTLRDVHTMEPVDEPAAHGYATDIPLNDLSSGMYVLRAEAALRGTDDLVYRQVPFEIGTSR